MRMGLAADHGGSDRTPLGRWSAGEVRSMIRQFDLTSSGIPFSASATNSPCHPTRSDRHVV